MEMTEDEVQARAFAMRITSPGLSEAAISVRGPRIHHNHVPHRSGVGIDQGLAPGEELDPISVAYSSMIAVTAWAAQGEAERGTRPLQEIVDALNNEDGPTELAAARLILADSVPCAPEIVS
jgi:acetyl/propionyl-CoA carboxylase alpha subunit